MNNSYDKNEIIKVTGDLVKNAKISIKLDGWPAAATCSVGIGGLTAIIITKIIKCSPDKEA